MDNVELYKFSSLGTFTADVENQHGWSGLTTRAACGCTPVSQHFFSVGLWLFSAVETAERTCDHCSSCCVKDNTKTYLSGINCQE